MLLTGPMQGRGLILFFIFTTTFAAFCAPFRKCPSAILFAATGRDPDASELLALAPNYLEDPAGAVNAAKKQLVAVKKKYETAKATTRSAKKLRPLLLEIRSLQQMVVHLIYQENFPADLAAAIRPWIGRELYLSAVEMIRPFRIRAELRKIRGTDAIAIRGSGGLDELIAQAGHTIPGEPCEVLYAPESLVEGETELKAAVDHPQRVFLVSHAAFSTQSPTHWERHELDHLRLEAVLANGLPSDFHGESLDLEGDLPGSGTSYAVFLKHHEPFNNFNDVVAAFADFKLAVTAGDESARAAAVARMFDFLQHGSNNAERQELIAKDLSEFYATLFAGPVASLNAGQAEFQNAAGQVWFREPVIGINQARYGFGIVMEVRGNGRRIPKLATVGRSTLYRLPLLGLKAEEGDELRRTLTEFLAAYRQFDVSKLERMRQAGLLKLPEKVAKLATVEYRSQARTAEALKTKFDELLLVTTLYRAMGGTSGQLYDAFVKLATEFAEHPVSAVRN